MFYNQQGKKSAISVIGVGSKILYTIIVVHRKTSSLYFMLPLAAWKILSGCWGQLNTFILGV